MVVNFCKPQRLQTNIEQYVSDNYDATLNITGNIGWSFFPDLGIAFGQATLTTKLDAPTKPLLAIQHMRASLAIMPLLNKEMVVQELYINQPQIALHTNAKGVSNWQVFSAKNATTDATQSAQSSSSQKNTSKTLVDTASTDQNNTTQNTGLPKITINKVMLAQADFHLIDAQTNDNIKVSGLNFVANNIKLDDWFSLQLSADSISYADQLQLAFKLTTDIKIKPDIQLKSVLLTSSITGNMIASISPEITLELGIATINTKLATQQQITINQLQLKATPILQQSVGLLGKKITYNSRNNGQVTANGLVLQMAGMQLNMAAKAKQITKALQFDASVTAKQFNAKEVLQKLGIALITNNPNAFTQAAINLTTSGSLTKIKTNGHINLDATKINLTASYWPKTSKAIADVRLNTIVLDDYLPPENTGTKTTNAPTASTRKQYFYHSTEPLLSVDVQQLLKNQNMRANITGQKIVFKKETFRQAKTKISINAGKANVDFSVHGLQGSINAVAALNLTTKNPSWQLQTKLHNLNAKNALIMLANQDKLAGNAYVQIRSQTSGNSIKALLANLRGTTSLRLEKGYIEGFDLSYQLCNAISKVKGKTAPQPPKTRKSPITALHASFIITKGVARGKDLIADIVDAKLSGKGAIDLKQLDLDYQAALNIVGNQMGEFCTANDTLRKLDFIVPCKGKMLEDKPAGLCHFDYRSLSKQLLSAANDKAQAEAKKAINKEIKKQRKKSEQKIKKVVEEKAKDLFKKLF